MAIAFQNLFNAFNRLIQNSKFKEYALLIPIGLFMSVVKVAIQGRAYAKEGFSQKDQKLLFTQEVVRQSISAILWLVSLTLSYELITKRLFPKVSAGGQLLISSILSQIPDSTLRPILTAKISKYMLSGNSTFSSPIKSPDPLQFQPPHQPILPLPKDKLVGATTLSATWPFYGSPQAYLLRSAFPTMSFGYRAYSMLQPMSPFR